jgi:predicted dehydrogenase/nucleoside-diphosphate-sugar epimerase
MPEEKSAPGNRIRVALFGGGKMAMHHIQAIRLHRSATVVAVADPAIAGKNGWKPLDKEMEVYPSAEDLLANSKPDVVHVCTPPSTHAPLARLALEHGAHVYVEKPFALSAHESREMISLAEEKGLKICAGHQLLFESPTLRADEQLKKIGRVVHIESYFSFRPVRRSRDGRGTISPIDQLVDILPHPVYLLLHFLKENNPSGDIPVQILSLDVKTSGNVHGVLRCGDAIGNLVVTLEGRPIESYVRVVGTNGCLFTKILNPYKQSWQIASGTTRALFQRFFKKQKSYPGLFEIIGKFYDSFPPGKPQAMGYSSIVETVAICEDVGKKLELVQREENIIAEKEHGRLESELAPADRSQGAVLITGGTGMLGKAVASEVRKANRTTRIVARKIPLLAKRIPGVEYVEADLAEDIAPEIFKDVSIVVHCAAETAGGKEAHERNSIAATQRMIESMHMAGVKRFIHVSSIAVLKTSRENGGPVSEDTPLADDSEERGPYVWGKTESERLARELSKHLGIGIRVIRPGPLVDYNAFDPPGRLGREVGSTFVYIGSKRSRISLCSVQTAASVIKKYVDEFDSMPPLLNLVEADSPTREELVSRLLLTRPDLKAVRIPSGVLIALSPPLTLIQRVMRPGKKPVDIYAAFASEEYDSTLAAEMIRSIRNTSKQKKKDAVQFPTPTATIS